MRPERLYLLDILEAADAIVEHLGGRDREGFLGDRTARAAVLPELRRRVAAIVERETESEEDSPV